MQTENIKSPRSSRRKRRRSSGLLPMIFRPFISVKNWLTAVSQWRVLTALPLFCYMFLGSIYALAVEQSLTDINSYTMFWRAGAFEIANDKLAAELLKQKVQFAGYGITLFLLLFKIRKFLSFFVRELTLVFLIFVISLSIVGSDYPDRVLINLAHLTMGIAATWLYFSDDQRHSRVIFNACSITFWPIMVTLSASVLLFVLHENSSIEALVDGSRYSGLSGNPNTLGGICIAGAWATMGLMNFTPFKSKKMVLLLSALAIVMFNALSSGSATTLLVISLTALLTVVFRISGRIGRKTTAFLIIGGTTAFFGLLFFLVIEQSGGQIALAATKSVGKDLTLTGRTDLWFTAWDAFKQKPLFGWGYDNHQTVFEEAIFKVPYNHYHNGYLDSLVSGGIAFGLAILMSFVTFFKRLRKASGSTEFSFLLLVALLALSIQNLTEYSLFRNNATIWHVYFIGFMAVSVVAINSRSGPAKTTTSRRRRRRSSPNMSW